ncbi:rCG57256, partial [Rattus norvegicus]
MLETYRNLNAIGYDWEHHTIEEHCQSSRRHTRHERSLTGEKPSGHIQCGKAFAYHGCPQRHERIHTIERPSEDFQYGEDFAYHSSLQIHKRTYSR